VAACALPLRSVLPPAEASWRILSIDGGGIRGLIAAKLLERLEDMLAAGDPPRRLVDCFDLIAGTSTGGLIALALAAPPPSGQAPMTAERLVDIYSGPEGRAVFERPAWRELPVIRRLVDLFAPRYSLRPLREELERQVGEAAVADAVTEILVTAFDMRTQEPVFFKRWDDAVNATSMVDAGLATAAAPTYFASHGALGGALVDGGVFAANPTVAAIVEALKRTVEPAPIERDDLLVVSLGTGHYERGFDLATVERWGALGWILPKGRSPLAGEPPLIGAMLEGQSDAAHHWAHVLLNHSPGQALAPAAERGAGPNYYRYELELLRPLPMDDAGAANIRHLEECADLLIARREDELSALAKALARSRVSGS
jgi:uncharacterized protein